MSHRRWCIKVAKEQAGCGATPVLLRILRFKIVETPGITELFATVSNPHLPQAERWRECHGKPLRIAKRINMSRQHGEAKRMKIVAKLVDRLEPNRLHPGGASLFEIHLAVVDEQNLRSRYIEDLQGVLVNRRLWFDPPHICGEYLVIEMLQPGKISPYVSHHVGRHVR